MSWRILLAANCIGALCTVTASAAVSQHVLIVGVNPSVDPGVPPLQFADDDAARYAELLGPDAASLEVLSVLDVQSQQRFPEIARRARPATLAELDKAVRQIHQRIADERLRHDEVDFIFIYVGHGARSDTGEGYVSLLDGKLTRAMLFGKILGPSPARFNHVVVDACAAYYLLNRSGDVAEAVRDFMDEQTLRKHPNTGAILATSRDRATHEWTRVEGGVFSHEILSALSGAADVDGDGSLRYDEIGAFVEAANQGVQDHRARIDLHLQPPRLMLERPLWRKQAQRWPRLLLSAAETGRYSVVDSRGVAVAELNKNAEQALAIALVGHAPFVVGHRGEDRQTASTVAGVIQLGELSDVDESLQERSALTSALERGLYTVPFGRSYVEGYRSRLLRDLGRDTEPGIVDTSAEPRTPDGMFWGGVGLGTAAITSLVVAGVATGMGVYAWQQLEQGKQVLRASEALVLIEQGNSAFWIAGIGAGATAILGLSGATLLLWSRPEESNEN